MSYNRNPAHVECVSKSYTDNNRNDWNHYKIMPSWALHNIAGNVDMKVQTI